MSDANRSSSSRSSSIASYNGGDGGGRENELIKFIYTKLAHEAEITSLEHIEAVDALCKLQHSLESANNASKKSQIRLICVIASLFRRCVRIEEKIAQRLHYSDDSETPEAAAEVADLRFQISDVMTTASLVFVVTVVIDVIALGGVPTNSKEAFKMLDEASNRSLWQSLCKNSKRKLELPEELQFNEKQRLLIEELCDRPFVESENSSSWSTMMAEPGLMANAAVRTAGSILSNSSEEALNEIHRLAMVFCQSTSAQMAVQMLKSNEDFISLAGQRISSLDSKQREDALLSVISAAESESGQSVLRDLIISFLLPSKVVGRRRTLLLSRETSARASKEFPWIASLAHEAAMQGAEYLFQHSKSEMKRTAALLAGIAIITTTGTDDVVRKATAFNGLVQLPFLETVPPTKRTQQRLALVPTTRSWALYTISATGKPSVQLSKRGFSGLVLALLCFTDSM